MNFPCSAARSETTTSWLIRPIIAATHQASADRARRQATVAASAPTITRAAAADSAAPRTPGRSTRGTRLSTTLPWSSGMGKTSSDCASSPTSPSTIHHRYGLRNRASSRRSGASGSSTGGSDLVTSIKILALPIPSLHSSRCYADERPWG